LLKGTKGYAVLARGGKYRDTPTDTQVPYLRTVLGFLGMTDVDFIYAEGLNMGPDAEAAALASARSDFDALLPEAAGELVRSVSSELVAAGSNGQGMQ
jgi:FMN-dependent NADH-azoreductase